MQIQVDIGFDQLVKLVKRLPSKQWAKLKNEVEKENRNTIEVSDLEKFLMSAPTFTEEQISRIDETRKAISQWRKK